MLSLYSIINGVLRQNCKRFDIKMEEITPKTSTQYLMLLHHVIYFVSGISFSNIISFLEKKCDNASVVKKSSPTFTSD